MAQKRSKIMAFYFLIMLFWMALYAYMPILSTHSAGLGADSVMVGTIISSYGFTQMLLRIPLGILSDKIGRRKPFVILGAFLTALSSLGLGLANTPVLLMLFRGLAGAAAATWVTYTVLFSSYFKPEESPQAMTFANAFNNGGQIIAMLLGGFLAGKIGNQAAFFLACTFGAGAIILSFLIAENRPQGGTRLTVKALLSVGLDKNLLFVSLLAIFYQVVSQGTTMGFIPTFATEIGATKSQLGTITSVTVAGSVLTSLIASKFLIARFGTRRLVIIGQIIATTASMLLPWVAGNVWILFAMQFVVGLGGGLNYPVLMGLAIKNIQSEKRGAAMGFFQSIYALGMFIGPLITGWLTKIAAAGGLSTLESLQVGLTVVSAIGIPALILSILFLDKIPGSQKKG
ncbi:MAG: MFS transporter [Clostridia bacterium]|nr:MFS transporter [Clostridia bacterium]